MAFEGLSSRLQSITRKIRGKARIKEREWIVIQRKIMRSMNDLVSMEDNYGLE